jgi:hypothetical protein
MTGAAHHKATPELMARAVELVRQGLDAQSVASRAGCSPSSVRRWAAEAGIDVPQRKARALDPDVIAACLERHDAGETLASLAREVNAAESTLTQGIRRLRQARDQGRRRARAAAARIAEAARRDEIAEAEAQFEVHGVRADGEPLIPSPMRWVRDLRPRGRRLVLELVDDGLGDVVLVARLEALHAAPTCRRCATEASTRPALAQESWQPSAGTWAARALMMLAGMTTLRTEVRDHDGGQAK